MDALLLLDVAAGAVLGGALVSALKGRKRPATPAEPAGKLTSSWRLAELDAPFVVARDVEAEVPAGAKVVAAGRVAAAAFAAGEVRQVPDVSAEFAVDAQRRKAILFLAGVRPGAQALVTGDPELVRRLAADAQGLWERGTPYVEQRPLSDAAAAAGLVIETQGTVQDVLPYQGKFLLRLEDGGQVLGVQVEKDAGELRGARVLVRGRVVKDARGYPTLEASDLRRIK